MACDHTGSEKWEESRIEKKKLLKLSFRLSNLYMMCRTHLSELPFSELGLQEL